MAGAHLMSLISVVYHLIMAGAHLMSLISVVYHLITAGAHLMSLISVVYQAGAHLMSLISAEVYSLQVGNWNLLNKNVKAKGIYSIP